MSEMRQDLLTGEWIIFATNRQQRPYDFVKAHMPKEEHRACPFCLGNEEETPGTIYQDGNNGTWEIRVFPNMYPAVGEEKEACAKDVFYQSQSGYGKHYVIVDTPNHTEEIQNFSHGHMVKMLQVLTKCRRIIQEDKKIAYIQIFKNKGPDAGASILHSHWQIIGMATVPKDQADAFLASKAYFEKNKRCIYCDMVKKELQEKIRIIEENDDFVAFAPYASKMAYEVSIFPKRHIQTYCELTQKELGQLAFILQHTLKRVSQVREDMCFNICFMDRPSGTAGAEHCHFYIRVIPRIGSFAGFEFATGSYINPIFPEEAASMYRRMQVKE